MRDLHTARRLAPDAPQPLLGLGKIYDARGEPAQAAEWYAQAADRLHDGDPTLLYTLALARYRSGVPVAARDPLRRALSRDDTMAEAHYLLGVVYSDTHDLDEAIASLERAVRLAPGLVPAREELAALYRRTGQVHDEIAQLRALADLDPQRDRRIAIALAQARDERVAEALATLADAASASTPTDSRIDLAIGRVRLGHAERTGDRGALAEARTALERALGGTARRSEGLALYGRALFLSGDVAEAEDILLEAIATSPVDPEAFAFLADAAERLSHPAVARDALLDLNAIEGSAAPAEVRAARARRIGALSLAKGDPHTALDFLNHAVAAGHADAQTLGLVARARWQTGDPVGAREALGRALALNSRDVELQRLQRAIRETADPADRAGDPRRN
jgi:tetratricopeptide (TPR) repeat protein